MPFPNNDAALVRSFALSGSAGRLWPAMAKAIEAIPALERDGHNPDTRSDYVTLGQMLDAVKPACRDNGLLLMQTASVRRNILTVTTRVVCIETGEWVEADAPLPLVGRTLKGGAKGEADPQSGGSATTYGRRYGLALLFSLFADRDDDARAARERAPARANSGKSRREPPPDAVIESPTTSAGLPKVEYVSGVIPKGDMAGKEFGECETEYLVKIQKWARRHGLKQMDIDVGKHLADRALKKPEAAYRAPAEMEGAGYGG